MEGTKYTTILHEVRKKFRLTNDEYCLADTIHKMSNRVDFPWCIEEKEVLGKSIGVSERTIYRMTAKLAKKGLIESSSEGLRSLPLWREVAETFAKMTKSSAKVAKSSAKMAGIYRDSSKDISNINSAKAEREVFSLEENLKKFEDSDLRHLNILAWYAREKTLNAENKEQWRNLFDPYWKTAKKLETYTDKQLVEAKEKVASKYTEWTLHTILKEFTK